MSYRVPVNPGELRTVAEIPLKYFSAGAIVLKDDFIGDTHRLQTWVIKRNRIRSNPGLQQRKIELEHRIVAIGAIVFAVSGRHIYRRKVRVASATATNRMVNDALLVEPARSSIYMNSRSCTTQISTV